MKKFFIMSALWSIYTFVAWAQPANYDAVMRQAKSLFDQKEYTKAIDCYEGIITELKGTEYESLVPSIRNSIAINNLYLGVAALQVKDYSTAKAYLEKAIKDAKQDSKTYYTIHSWMGQWYSAQSLSIRAARGDLEQALKLSLEAERYFHLAKAPQKRLNEQLSRASILQDLTRNEEAEDLLNQIMTECEGLEGSHIILGKAAFKLGGIELDAERFQLAIQHLEQGYDICITGSTVDSRSYAYLCADKLCWLFSNRIPDNEKASLWKQRAEELESQIAK